jgi:predicted nucleic acid-binding protein
MSRIPANRHVFLDTNILLYSISNHPLFSRWCNELLHNLIIAEVAQKYNLKPRQVPLRIKQNRSMLDELQAYLVIEDVVENYGLKILPVTTESFKLALKFIQQYRIFSNDALHLAVMNQFEISDLASNDKDFDPISDIKIWKPQPQQ